MEIKYSVSPNELKHLSTGQIRDQILITKVFESGKALFTYSFDERFILGGICPTDSEIILESQDEIRQDYFLKTREMGIINIGGPGCIKADNETFELDYEDGAYIGCETKKVSFSSKDSVHPAKFYATSLLAFKKYPNCKIPKNTISLNPCGDQSGASKRIVKKYIYKGGPVLSNQLQMGINSIQPGNVWNTLPTHSHKRRVECFMYYNLPADAFYIEIFGDPKESRHLVIRNEQAMVSAAWQMHFGVGTTHYDFIWAMGGENQDFPDMDTIAMCEVE